MICAALRDGKWRIALVALSMMIALLVCAPIALADDETAGSSEGDQVVVTAEAATEGEKSADEPLAAESGKEQGENNETPVEATPTADSEQPAASADGGDSTPSTEPSGNDVTTEAGVDSAAGNVASDAPSATQAQTTTTNEPATSAAPAAAAASEAPTAPTAAVPTAAQKPAVQKSQTAEPAAPAASAKQAAASPAKASVKAPAKAAKKAVAASKEQPVENGVYWISSFKVPKQAIGIDSSSATLTNRAKGDALQKWKFTWKSGYYEVLNVQTGRALTLTTGKSGYDVVQAKRNKSLLQRWSLKKSSDGRFFFIENAKTGMRLNIAGKLAAGTNVNARSTGKKAAQTFILRKTAVVDEGSYLALSAAGKRFALSASGVKPGAQAVLGKKSKTLAMRFYVRNEADGTYSFQSVSTGLFIADHKGKAVLKPWSEDASLCWNGTYANGIKFTNAASGKALGIAGGKAKAGAKTVAEDPSSARSQRWVFTPRGLLSTGTYTLSSKAGGYLDVAKASYAPGTNIRVLDQKSANGSQCFGVYADGNRCRLVNMRTYQAVDIADASTKGGANVQQGIQKDTAKSQLWKPSILRDGSIVFKNARSGLVLTRGSKGANVVQRADTGARHQRWQLESVERYSLSGNAKLDRNVATILASRSSLSSAFKYVVGYSYREGKRFYGGSRYLSTATTISYANDMYSHHSGNCYRFASLFAWLARGLGYSTKVVSGWVPGAAVAQAPHGWVELKMNGKTYICDPDLSHEMPGHKWFLTTYSSAPTTYGRW